MFSISYQDLVQWEGYDMIKYNDGRSKFLVTPEYQLQDYCDVQSKCGQNQTCLNLFNNNIAAQYGTSQIEYNVLQIKSWSNAYQDKWELLNNNTKQYIIQTIFSSYVYQTFAVNLAASGNKVFSAYQMRQSDGTGLIFYLNNRLINSAISKQKYGGPFNCTKINGAYNQYKFTDVSQFDGFQYIDQSLNPCLKDNNQTNQCSCPYFNTKRLIPTEWRCRPWYLGGSSSSYIVFNEPQLNLKLNQQTSIITFKIVGNTNEQDPIKNEANMQPDAILGVEIDVNNIQIDKSGTFDEEYLYLVAPKRFNYDQGKGYYQYTAILHPDLKLNQKSNITTLEFNNSINRDEEISQYLNKTSFLVQDQLIYEGCRSVVNLSEQIQINYMKNQSELASIFTPIKVCYGNMYNQQQQIIGYLSKSLKLDIISKQVEEQVKEIRLMLIRFVVIIFSVFNFLVIIMFLIFRLTIISNFEVPVKILSQFINEADSQCIYIFNQMVKNGKLKTQYELKNLIDAISNAVIGIQFKIENYFKFEESETQFSELLSNLQQGIETFQALQNKQGVGMCFDLVTCHTPKTRKQSLSFNKSTINKNQEKLPEYQEYKTKKGWIHPGNNIRAIYITSYFGNQIL
ncbi:transmembrane protein, putative (macronuclear) [Tetrahymena thermophila SB210]|uniref:Transmembrane protein, putative n=1 Tax=Tetrahymena thermophila (strain SB210) TaxID=312017 RepID=Q22DT3_TETTS|nr:transmembrane protein, putative [Tetrahymena thermophila SB210]EAR83472.2 transmembrane protein, putative [Tetrahymena thermophila SB210]|eukprot:XP_001031135.2 transmembrane protein, putative [Tetrahymena thermophila SB210]